MIREATTLRKMEPHQELLEQHPNWFELMQIDFVGACKKQYVTKFLIVSHRWEQRGEPDPHGKQWVKIRNFLEEHREIDYVWIECADSARLPCPWHCS